MTETIHEGEMSSEPLPSPGGPPSGAMHTRAVRHTQRSPWLLLRAAQAVAARLALGLLVCLSLGLVVIPALAILNAVPLLLGGAKTGRMETERFRFGWRLLH